MSNNCLNQLKLLENKKILPHAILLSGDPNQSIIIAKNFSQWLLCEDPNKKNLNKIDHCKCKSCMVFIHQNHPDYLLIDLEVDQTITIDLIRNAINFVNTTPYLTNRKVLLIPNIHNINKQAANAFLKTLEEPLLSSKVLILLTSNYHEILPDTILSRIIHINIGQQLTTNKEQNSGKSNFTTPHDDLQTEILQDLYTIWDQAPANIIKIIEKWDKLPKSQLIYTLWEIMTKIIKANDPGILLQIKQKVPIQSLWLSLDNLNYLNKTIILGQQINWRLFLYNFVLTIPIVDGN